jgi:hypothetical protein
MLVLQLGRLPLYGLDLRDHTIVVLRQKCMKQATNPQLANAKLCLEVSCVCAQIESCDAEMPGRGIDI